MKTSKLITALLICLAFLLVLFYALESDKRVISLTGQINDLNANFGAMRTVHAEMKSNIIERNKSQQEEVERLTETIKQLQDSKQDKPNRGGERGTRMMMEVTAYWEGSCGKELGHPLYGITASGKYVQEWYTVAAGPELPFGAQIYIPYFSEMSNNGVFVVADRGGMITDGHIDVYMKDYNTCMKFGRQQLEVYILD